MRISKDDQSRVSEAIRAAEQTTSGEFVCVLARSAGHYRFFPLAWAAPFGLATPWLLLSTAWSVEGLLLAQLAVFAAVFAGLSWPPLRRLIVPRAVQRAVAHRAAAEQFLIHGLARTPHRRGILLYVAQEEHYARVLADAGVADAIPAERWRETVAHLVAQARAGRHADGFVKALDHCTTVMRDAFPGEPSGAKVLPDKFFILD
ncbi:hypothetical protein P7D22_13765 [Lichenihabitans sp. Uapishka_5]|uniref:TPM domain-containing protein n=1 Tax=Lichenihabitans sp. Uapishka_5 TaxID=3037302 RepID=UPI0029E81582|nr:TPM domain-containing protein [Lichenihabitans sp. Uapishka_5]MDX7952242.1 hypothetical protein [Lichenihabitans sp. Uapishka_5]